MSTCTYIFTKGNSQGQACGKETVSGYNFCLKCITKTGAVKSIVKSRLEIKPQHKDVKQNSPINEKTTTVKHSEFNIKAIVKKQQTELGQTDHEAMSTIVKITKLKEQMIKDHLTLVLNDDPFVKYLNLSTKKQVAESSAMKKACIDHTYKICVDGDTPELIRHFDLLLSTFSIVLSTIKVDDFEDLKKDQSNEVEKLIDAMINKELPTRQSKRVAVSKELRTKIFQESKGKCYSCQTMITASFFELGHIVPHKYGGEAKGSNLKAICLKCNDDMGTMHMYEFMGKKDCRKVATMESMTKMFKALSLPKLKDEYHAKIIGILDSPKKYYIDQRIELINAVVDKYL